MQYSFHHFRPAGKSSPGAVARCTFRPAFDAAAAAIAADPSIVGGTDWPDFNTFISGPTPRTSSTLELYHA